MVVVLGIAFCDKTVFEAGGMAQWLGACTVLAEDLGMVPSTILDALQMPLTSVPGCLVAFAGTAHKLTRTHNMLSHAQMITLIVIIINE